jgi:hypothetical protein
MLPHVAGSTIVTGLHFPVDHTVRRFIPGIALALLAAGCQASSGVDRAHPDPARPVAVSGPTPFTEVTEGPVHALIPHHWAEAPIASPDSVREGLMASPHLDRWKLDGSVPGMEVTWVDASRARIPSSYFYVAAKWPALPPLAASGDCRSSFQRVLVDHGTLFDRVHEGNEGIGDFAASATGTCRGHGQINRWAYFISAPSLGPERRIGLPNSGLYMAVAVMHDGPRAPHMLHRMLYGTRFGKATIADLVVAARESAKLSA